MSNFFASALHFGKNKRFLSSGLGNVGNLEKINSMCFKSTFNTEWREKMFLVNTGLIGLEIYLMKDLIRIADQRNLNLYVFRYNSMLCDSPQFRE